MCVCVCLLALSRLNHLRYGHEIWYSDWPWLYFGLVWRSKVNVTRLKNVISNDVRCHRFVTVFFVVAHICLISKSRRPHGWVICHQVLRGALIQNLVTADFQMVPLTSYLGNPSGPKLSQYIVARPVTKTQIDVTMGCFRLNLGLLDWSKNFLWSVWANLGRLDLSHLKGQGPCFPYTEQYSNSSDRPI